MSRVGWLDSSGKSGDFNIPAISSYDSACLSWCCWAWRSALWRVTEDGCRPKSTWGIELTETRRQPKTSQSRQLQLLFKDKTLRVLIHPKGPSGMYPHPTPR